MNSIGMPDAVRRRPVATRARLRYQDRAFVRSPTVPICGCVILGALKTATDSEASWEAGSSTPPAVIRSQSPLPRAPSPPVGRTFTPCAGSSPLSVASGPESGAYAAIPEIRRRSHSDQSHGVRRRTVGVWDQQEAGKLDVNVASLKTCVGGPETTRGEGHR